MTNEITQKVVQMTVADYRAAANEAIEQAVGWLRQEPTGDIGRAGRLAHAADMLRAADTFNGRANMMENFGPAFDETLIEVWPQYEAA